MLTPKRWLSYGCQSTSDFQYPWQSTLGCTIISDSDYPFTTSIEVLDGTSSYASSRTFSGYGGINAYSVAIRFQQSDITTSSSTTTTAVSVTSSSSTLPIATSSASSSGSSNSTTSSSGINAGLSSGAAAGVGVAVAVVGILAVGASLYFLRRAKRKAAGFSKESFKDDRPELGTGNELNPREAPQPEMAGGYHGDLHNLGELRAEEVAKEIDGRIQPAELDASQRAELQ